MSVRGPDLESALGAADGVGLDGKFNSDNRGYWYGASGRGLLVRSTKRVIIEPKVIISAKKLEEWSIYEGRIAKCEGGFGNSE